MTSNSDWPFLTITRNEESLNASRPLTYQDKVNSDTFFCFLPQTVKCNKISAQLAFENNVSFWKVTYEFEMRKG